MGVVPELQRSYKMFTYNNRFSLRLSYCGWETAQAHLRHVILLELGFRGRLSLSSLQSLVVQERVSPALSCILTLLFCFNWGARSFAAAQLR